MSNLTFRKGNAAEPLPNVCIAHICNDIGVWGGGFVIAVTKNVGELPCAVYKEKIARIRARKKSPLGDLQLVAIPDVVNGYVANMVAQRGVVYPGDKIDYEALRKCILELGKFCKEHALTVHMPRIGCGLAGSDWQKISPYVELLSNYCPVVVFDF